MPHAGRAPREAAAAERHRPLLHDDGPAARALQEQHEASRVAVDAREAHRGPQPEGTLRRAVGLGVLHEETHPLQRQRLARGPREPLALPPPHRLGRTSPRRELPVEPLFEGGARLHGGAARAPQGLRREGLHLGAIGHPLGALPRLHDAPQVEVKRAGGAIGREGGAASEGRDGEEGEAEEGAHERRVP
jgi:hypothetical protein